VKFLSVDVDMHLPRRRGDADSGRSVLKALRDFAQKRHKILTRSSNPATVAPLELEQLSDHPLHLGDVDGHACPLLAIWQEFERHFHTSDRRPQLVADVE
jgi:hypothetical protein